MGKALFDHPENIFPSNATDIERVCSDVFPKMWSEFINCTKSFAASCISSAELSHFNRAVGNSINSVHKMCTNEDYKRDYLKSAICIKSAAIEESGCKSFYDSLLNEINSPSESETLCCAHTAFKECLMEETKSCTTTTTGHNTSGQAASRFARSIVENAIGFLLNRCSKGSISNVCQKFTPSNPVSFNEEPGHSLDGNYFPSPEEDRSTSSTSQSTVSISSTSIETERMPKQDANIHVGEVPDIVRDGLQKNSVKLTSPPDDDNNNNNEDESINFDEFFDLAVLQNDLLSSSQSTSSNQMVLGISVLLTCLILSLCNST